MGTRKPTNPYAAYNENGHTVIPKAPVISGIKADEAPHTYAQRKRQNRRKRRIKRIISALIAVVVICGALLGGLYIYLDSYFNEGDSGKLTDDIISTPDEFKGDYVNILVCGIDYDAEDDGRDYSEGKGMTDLIMYVSFDVKNKSVNILQIPRDSYVGDAYNTGGTGKINAVYSHGEDQQNLITNLAKVLNEQYSLPVDYYMTIDMAGFKEIYRRLNIALGGIEIYVPWDVNYYDEATGQTITVPQGYQVMDEEHVEWILRQRKDYSQGDIKRLELQQYFYAAMFKAFKQVAPADLVQFMPTFKYFVNTDLSAADAISLGMSLLKVEGQNITIYRSPGGPITMNGQSCYGVNPVNMAEMLNNHFRIYGDPVPVLDKLPTNFEYTLGEIYDEGKSMASIEQSQTDENAA